MANNVTPGLAVTYIRSTGEHVPATIIGPSRHGDNYIHLKYMRNGKETEHNAVFDKVLFPIHSPPPSPSEGSPTRGRSPTRSPSPRVRAGLAPVVALPVGWELATTKDGIPYYMDHNRGITTWERLELPAYPGPPGAAKPLKHRLPADKCRVTHGPLDRFFRPTASAATSAPSSATPSTSADVATSSSNAAVVDCTPLPAKRRRRSAEDVLARPKRVHQSARDKVRIMTYADEYGAPGKCEAGF